MQLFYEDTDFFMIVKCVLIVLLINNLNRQHSEYKNVTRLKLKSHNCIFKREADVIL